MMVQIGYVDFADPGFSAKGTYFKDFKHGDSRMLSECWYDGEHFIVVTEENEEIIVNKNEARGWTTLQPISWRRGEHLKSPDEIAKILQAREARAAKRK